MPGAATLESRIPQIMAQLPVRTAVAAAEGAALIAERARERAPIETGRLRNSIHVEPVSGGASVVADATDDNGYHYAVVVEYGGHIGKGNAGPHAFMTPAAEECRERIIEHIAVTTREL